MRAGGPVHPRRLGAEPVARGERRGARRHAELRPHLGGLPARDAGRARPGRSACPRGRWATPRSATPTSARGAWCGWTCRASTTPSRTGASRRNAALAALRRGGEGERRHGAPRRPRLAGRGACAPAPHRRGGAGVIAAAGVPVAVHAFLDGRDVPPKIGRGPDRRARGRPAGGRAHRHRLGALLRHGPRQALGPGGAGAWRRCCAARACAPPSAAAAVAAGYARGETDEFVDADGDRRLRRRRGTATGSSSPTSAPTGRGRSSARWSTRTSTAFDAGPRPRWAALLGMVEYSDRLDALMPAMFPATDIVNTLGAWVAAQGPAASSALAETEKYPHVTFFLNGGVETPAIRARTRHMAPSPKVAHLRPRSRRWPAAEVTEHLVARDPLGRLRPDRRELRQPRHGRATPAILAAAIKAVEAVDRGLGEALAGAARTRTAR